MSPLLYLTQVSLLSLLFWGVFRSVWHRRTGYRLARAYLLFTLLLAPLLPFIRAFFAGDTLHAYRIILPEIRIGVQEVQASTGMASANLLICMYGCMSGLILLFCARQYFHIWQLLKRGISERHPGYVIVRHTGIGPGTFGRNIFFPQDIPDERILRHELAHIHSYHHLDLLLAQIMTIVFWLSPAHWLIQKELKMLHEFEADAIAVGADDAQAYARLLLAHDLGIANDNLIAHSFFNHPIKRRIIMLSEHQKKPRIGRLLLKSGILSSAIICLCLLTRFEPQSLAKSAPQPMTPAPYLTDQHATADAENSDTTVRYVENMPTFKGDLGKYLSEHTKYPETSRKTGTQGRVGVEFVVRKDGKVDRVKIVRSSGNAELDSEAIRVIRSLPAWNPGTEKGKPVDVFYTIPISFQLEGK